MSPSRRRVIGMALLLLAIGFFSGLLSSSAAAKSLTIPQVEINARLRPDGSMDVSEARTYRFRGSFSYAFRDMPRDGPVAFEGFEVSENGRPYRLSNTEEPGTYSISSTSRGTRITWHYRANNESRTFEFRYRAREAVVRHDDAAVLYYQFLSEDWDMPQYNISLRVVPPAALSRDEVRVWLHGPLWAESRLTDAGEILAHCSQLPARRYLEVRALYPPELFPGAPGRPGEVRSGIMAEEAAWAEESNRIREAARERAVTREKRLRMGRWLMAAIGLAGLFGWWRLYKEYGMRPALPQFLDISSDIPAKTPPALVGYLIRNRQVAGQDLVGTMLDLARRGFVELREERVEKRSFWGGVGEKSEYYWDLKRTHYGQHASKLAEYERSLIEFIFGELAEGGDSISLDTVKKKRGEFIKFFRKWRKTVSGLGEEKNWFDKASIRGTYYSLALGGVMLALAAGGAFLFHLWAIVLGVAGMTVIVLSFLIYHRTAEGETEARHWQALRKYLKSYEFRSADRRDLLPRVSDYLVYGVVLGLSTRFYRELAAVIPEREYSAYVPWYIYHGAGTRGFSPAAFGEAFSSMVTSTTSTMSSASGAGGGASVGGGGGASSGGGGAG